jgi:hypothetical protein
MIRKILYYKLENLPKDSLHFFNAEESGMIIVSCFYIIFAAIIIYLSVNLIKYSMLRAGVFYLLCVMLNCIILNRYNYLLYLSKNQHSMIVKILFVLSGPLGILKALYLIICLYTMTSDAQFQLIIRNPPSLWHDTLAETPENRFMLSLAKYQKRLKGHN